MSYLRNIARRAVGEVPRVLRPRRLMYAPVPVAAPEETPVASAPAAIVPSAPREPLAPTAPITRAAPVSSVAPVTVPRGGDDGAIEVARTPRREQPTPGVSVERPWITPPSPIGAAPPAVPATPDARESDDARADDPMPRAPAVVRRNLPPVSPDPLAQALAVAVRWTATGAPRSRPDETIEAERAPIGRRAPEPAAPPAPMPPPAGAAALAVTAPPPRQDAAPKPRPPAPVAPQIPPTSRVRPAPAPRPTVRIGSLEVRVVPPPAPAAAPVPRAPAAPPSGPLARGLTSSIGLRQS